MDLDKIRAFEMKCYRKLLKISWTDKIGNEESYSQLQIENLYLNAQYKHEFPWTNQTTGHTGKDGRDNLGYINKTFWSYIKSQRNERSGIADLFDKDKWISDTTQKAKIFNAQFSRFLCSQSPV